MNLGTSFRESRAGGGVSSRCYAPDVEGAASLPHRWEAGELTLARRRCSSGSPLYAAATCRSLPDDCQGRRSLRGGRGGGCCPEPARTHPTPSTGLWGVGCSGARSRCSCPSPPNPASATPRGRCSSSHATPHAAPLKRGGDVLAPPPWQSLNARLRRDAVQCCARICCAMPCEAVLCSATLCYDVLLGESASLRDWSSDARVARGGRAARLGRYATSATVERSA